VEDNQNSRGAWHANTNRGKQEYAVRVSLRLETAVEAISKRENRNKEEKRFSH
jgi:hypothetical protein